MIKKGIMEENAHNTHTKSNQKTNSSKITLYKHCVNVLFSENNFISQVNCFIRLMI